MITFGVFFKLLCLFIKYEFAKLNSCGNSENYLSNVIILIKKRDYDFKYSQNYIIAKISQFLKEKFS